MQIQNNKTEFSKVFQEWKLTTLSKVLLNLESGARAKGGSVKYGIPSLGGEHITKDGKLNLRDLKYVPETFFSTMKKGIIKDRDVLLVKDGATIGKTTIIRKLPFEKMAVNEHVFILRGNNSLDQEFLFYYISQANIQNRIKAIQTGSAQPGINSTFPNHLEIYLPPLNQQQKITSILSNVDELIQKTEQIIEQTQRLKKGLMQTILT